MLLILLVLLIAPVPPGADRDAMLGLMSVPKAWGTLIYANECPTKPMGWGCCFGRKGALGWKRLILPQCRRQVS